MAVVAVLDGSDAIALAGFSRTRHEHSYETRFSPIIEKAIEYRMARGLQGKDIDFQRFEAIVKLNRLNALLRLLKLIILMPCLLVFGRRRGPRAARRFLFELSWRFLGKKTYSASSWVGRLFYEHS